MSGITAVTAVIKQSTTREHGADRKQSHEPSHAPDSATEWNELDGETLRARVRAYRAARLGR